MRKFIIGLWIVIAVAAAVAQTRPGGGGSGSGGTSGPLTLPQLTVSKTFTVTPQTVRGIVGAFSGQSTSNGTAFMDVFPFGYNPWGTGIRFQDSATDTFGSAIELGLTADAVSSQHIRFYSQRTATFDSVFDLFMKGGTLIWAGGLALGQPGVSGCYENAYASRFCYDATNGNAIVHAGGSVVATNLGVGFTSGATAGATYWGLFDKSGNFGVGSQHDESIANVALQNPFNVAGPAQAVPGAVTAPLITKTGLPTGCAQFPCVAFETSVLNQTAALSTNPVYVPTVAGTYRFSCAMYIVTAGTAGTMQCGFTWRSGVTGGLSSSGASNTANMFPTAGLYTQATIIAHLDGVIGVNFFTNYTGATGTPVYNVDIVIERLQ